MNQPYPTNPIPAAKPKKKRTGLKILLVVVAAFIGIGIIAGNSGKPAGTETQEEACARSSYAVGCVPPDGPTRVGAPAPTQTPPVVAASADGSWGSGTYEVVKSASSANEITAGRLKTAGPDQSSIIPSCYWARLKNDSGGFDAIISNANLQGPGSVTVKVGEFLELSGSCVWTK